MSNQNYKEFFTEAINQIHQEMIAANQEDDFKLWFNMEYVDDSLSQINVTVPSEFMWMKMIQNGYITKTENKILELTGQTIKIEHVVKKSDSVQPAAEKIEEQKKEVKKETKPVNKEEIKKHPQLREDFTFENFIPGDNSIYAYNASIAAADKPGKAFNPILIYGGVGLGKTHLMQAIGNKIYAKESDKKISYLSAENFTNEFTTAVRNQSTDRQSMEKFKKKYRNLDVLLLDDIQFLEGKDQTQEELFHTFNSIYDRAGQIVFTSDRPIKEIKGFTERLSSRFSRGLNVDLQPPSYENRIAIIQKKLEIQGKEIPKDVIEYIAKNCQTNVRDIEACILKSIGYAELVKKTLTVEIAQNILRDTINNPYSGTITIENIQKVVAEHYNISISDIKGKKKERKYVMPRQIAVYISCVLTEYSTTEIGTEFGGRDHTTIMHARDKIENMLKTDPSLDSTINLLTREAKDYKKI